MVDLCRPSSLPNNQTLGTSDENKTTNNINDEHKRIFPPVILPHSSLLNPNRIDSMMTVAPARTVAPIGASFIEQPFLQEEKFRVQHKDKKDQSANASIEVKTYLRNFIHEKLQREGKFNSNELNDSLRRFRSEPLLQNPLPGPKGPKMNSHIRDGLYRHRHKTPLSDERHRIRSTNIAQVNAPNISIPPIPFTPLASGPIVIPSAEQVLSSLTFLQPRLLYASRSTGSLVENDGKNSSDPNKNHRFGTILEPRYFIHEVENEAILAKEFEDATIQSTHNSRISLHGSQPQLFNLEKKLSFHDKFLPVDRLGLSSKSLSSLSTRRTSTEKNIPKSLSGTIQMRFTTGIAYDEETLKHECYCQQDHLHLENPRRLLAIYEYLKRSHLLEDCKIIRGFCATIDMLTECHDFPHVYLYGCDPRQRTIQSAAIIEQDGILFEKLPCGGVGIQHDMDTIWNEDYTARACRFAVGNTIELAKHVIDGTLHNGFALVRPPGHHATNKPIGFCYFNTVAIAAKFLKKHRKLQRIAIVDWDIHHGNGTQDLTYDDPNILYISLHRYDQGTYFPGTGHVNECGSGLGLGKNVNIPFSGEPNSLMTDVEYLAAFRSIVIPILDMFQPQIILVSSGFDACIGHEHPLGGYKLTPTCFAHMTRALMHFADGKVVLVLEGGYELNALAACGCICVETLLNRPIQPFPLETLRATPQEDAIRTLTDVIQVQREFWPGIERFERLISISHEQAASG